MSIRANIDSIRAAARRMRSIVDSVVAHSNRTAWREDEGISGLEIGRKKRKKEKNQGKALHLVTLILTTPLVLVVRAIPLPATTPLSEA